MFAHNIWVTKKTFKVELTALGQIDCARTLLKFKIKTTYCVQCIGVTNNYEVLLFISLHGRDKLRKQYHKTLDYIHPSFVEA